MVWSALISGVLLVAGGCNTETTAPPKVTAAGIPAATMRGEAKTEPPATPQPAPAPVAAQTQPAPVSVASKSLLLSQANPRPREPVLAQASTQTSERSIQTPSNIVPVQTQAKPLSTAMVPPIAVVTPVPAEESSSGNVALVLLSIAVVWAITMGIYGNSETARVRRQARETMADFEGALQSQQGLIEKLQTEYKTAAADYLASTRRRYLEQISVDEIRKVTPGVRLQPLKEHGVSNLLACQGWTADRLTQLRGIGPESASRIALAIVALTKSVNNQAVPHPRPGGAGADRIYRPLYLVRRVRLEFFEQMPALQAICEELGPQCASVQERTSFFRWLFGSQTKGTLHDALEAGKALSAKSKPTEKEGAALALAKERYTAARQLVDSKVSSDLWVADVPQAEDYYREGLEQVLGRDATPRMAVSTPRVVTVPARTTKTPELERPSPRSVAVSRDLNTSQPTTPATEPVPMRIGGLDRGAGFRISIKIGEVEIDPVPPKSEGRVADCWVPKGQSKMVGNVALEGGLLYVGRNLSSVNRRSVEPALIDPSLAVAAREANCRVRMLDYWSNYTYASPGARASYLQWLVTGRQDPEADIGYVFLYFYGLERRALADARADPVAQAEIPAIVAEVHRLRSIYAQRASFDRYSAELLDYLDGVQATGGGDSDEPPKLRQYHLSFALKRRLGQFAEERRPLPAKWAYTWYHNDPRTRLPAVAFRCPEQLAELFRRQYHRQFSDGLIVAAGKTRLQLSYRPASASFGTTLDQSMDLPDVTVMSGSYIKLEAVAQECYAQLDAYSRFLGRNKEGHKSFDGLILLPVSLWPESRRAGIEDLQARAGDYPTCTLREFLAPWGKQEQLTRTTYLGLCRTLAGAGLGLEPDPRFGTEVPDLDDMVAFFPGEASDQPSAGFGLAALLLRLASTVASADGDPSEAEAQHLREEIEGNPDLTPGERRRLLARMALYRIKAPALTGLKSAVAGRSEEERQRLTDFLLSMAFADGSVTPGEVKVMEKVYGLFGLDPAALYTRLHGLSAGSAPAVTKAEAAGPIRLDAAKVKQLREASEEVTRKLAVIFSAEQPPGEAVPEVEKDPAGVDPSATVLALDEAHAGLLVLLTGRPQWARLEFEDVCADRGLMPDGAIERINEAAFARFDQPVIDGDDPLEIAIHLLEEQIYAADYTTKGP